MLRIQIKKLLMAQPALGVLSETKLPIQAAFKVSKLLDEAGKVFEELEIERVRIAKVVDAQDEEAKPAAIKAADEEINVWAEQEREINVTKIQMDSLGDMVITPAHMLQLSWFFDVEDEQADQEESVDQEEGEQHV